MKGKPKVNDASEAPLEPVAAAPRRGRRDASDPHLAVKKKIVALAKAIDHADGLPEDARNITISEAEVLHQLVTKLQSVAVSVSRALAAAKMQTKPDASDGPLFAQPIVPATAEEHQ